MTAGFGGSPPFPEAAQAAVEDSQLRANLRRATRTIRAKRDRVVGELADFEELRRSAAAIKDDAMGRLDELLEQLEDQVRARGGHVHFARHAADANRLVTRLVRETGADEVVKVKSMTTAEIGLNEALQADGITARETDLAELIVQLGADLPSHIVVPAIHRNRAEIRSIFLEHMGEHGLAAPAGMSDDPVQLAGAARAHLREQFLRARVAISGANFAVAESGSLVVVESEGNGRMCLSLPETLISVVGIDKVIPRFSDLEVFLQLLARSATGERMNPYTSIWSGPTPGDGPREFHLVLVDNGRSAALADRVGRQALRCIRCAACLNVCPVYERVGGHAYGSVYPGPIGAVLTPQLEGVASDAVAASLPFASTLCGACFEVCPVRIDIPRLLVHLRARTVEDKQRTGPSGERVAMAAAAYVLSSPRRLERFERFGGRIARPLSRAGRSGRIRQLPGPLGRWTSARDAPLPATRSFREWWRLEHEGSPGPRAMTEPRGPKAGPGESSGAANWRRLALFVTTTLTTWRPRRPPATPGHDRRPGDGADQRAEVLGAIRGALAAAPYAQAAVPRDYRGAGEHNLASPLQLFADRLVDYQAQVTRTSRGEIGAAVARALARAGSASVAVPVDLPEAWLPEGWLADAGSLRVHRDSASLGPLDLDRIDATVSGCAVAIADTGTIILDAGPAQGRRALSLIPDHLVVVVLAEQVVPSVPDAIPRLSPQAPQTWISGPSATSDIELSRVEGVHGPRRLDVIIAEPSG